MQLQLVLASNDVFRNHFKGLYFKVEKIREQLVKWQCLIWSRKITIKYKENSPEPDAGTRVDKSIVLNLTGTTVNLLSDVNKPAYEAAISSANSTTGF
jgi:hypothetical protein